MHLHAFTVCNSLLLFTCLKSQPFLHSLPRHSLNKSLLLIVKPSCKHCKRSDLRTILALTKNINISQNIPAEHLFFSIIKFPNPFHHHFNPQFPKTLTCTPWNINTYTNPTFVTSFKMFFPLFLLFTPFLGLLQAQGAAGPVGKSCFNVTSPVTVTSNNFNWAIPKFSDNLDLTELNTELNTRGFAAIFNPLSGPQRETATYQITGTFCEPGDRKASTLLLATHGATLYR